jgi:hypothetical protein
MDISSCGNLDMSATVRTLAEVLKPKISLANRWCSYEQQAILKEIY